MKKHIEFKDFYHEFFNNLLNSNLKYSVVRNYEGLPNEKPGGDVDILIEREKINEVLNIIRKILEPVNGRVEITSTRFYVVKLKLHKIIDNHTKLPITELDLIIKLSWKGLNWLSESEVLNQSILNNQSIYYPSSRHELQMSLFHSLLYGGFVKERYCKNMAILFIKSNKKLLKYDLIKNFGHQVANFIFNNLEKSDWNSLQNHSNEIRKSLFKIRLKQSFFKTILQIPLHYYFEIKIRINRYFNLKKNYL